MWIVNAFQGEFGESYILRVDIAQLLGTKFWLSLGICLSSLVLAYLIAIPVGIISAATNNPFLNNGLKLVNYLGLAMPNFLLALMIMLFSTIYFGDTLTGLFPRNTVMPPGAGINLSICSSTPGCRFSFSAGRPPPLPCRLCGH